MSRTAALGEHDDESDKDHIIVLHDVSWEDYEYLLRIRGEHSAPRISYLEGELEIMSRPYAISGRHWLGRLHTCAGKARHSASDCATSASPTCSSS